MINLCSPGPVPPQYILQEIDDQRTPGPNIKLGISFSFVSLFLLGIMPVISNSRPEELNALNFALYLSIWLLTCSLPLLIAEPRFNNPGIFATRLPEKTRNRAITIIMVLAALFLRENIAGYQISTMVLVAASIYGLLYAGKTRRAAAAQTVF